MITNITDNKLKLEQQILSLRRLLDESEKQCRVAYDKIDKLELKLKAAYSHACNPEL